MDYFPARTVSRAEVVRVARAWAGTPYRHQGRAKGRHVDCIGYVWGVARDLGYHREIPANYSRLPSGRQLQNGCDEMLVRRPANDTVPGSIGIFFGVDPGEAQHFAIFTGTIAHLPHMIHAFSRHGQVIETRFDRFWERRLVAVYDFPMVEDPAQSAAQSIAQEPAEGATP